jgi:hypothetical protein
MERLALIEVLDHDGRVLHAVPVTRWPLTIGRAVDCDVVLHDPFVAARHATIDATPDAADAGLRITVGDTVNGVQMAGRTLGAGVAAALPSGAVWRAGRTALRVRLPGEALAPEQPLAHPAQRRHALLTGAAAAIVLLWVSTLLWLDNEPGARWDQYVPSLLGAVAGVVAWCALWGLGSKLFQRRFRFAPHLRVLLAFSLASFVLDALLALGSFALSWPWLSHIREWITIAFVAGLVGTHLSLLLPGRERTIAAVFGALLVVAIGINAAFSWRQRDRVFTELYSTTLPPPALRLVSPAPVAALIDDLRPLQQALEKRAQDEEDIDAASGTDEP